MDSAAFPAQNVAFFCSHCQSENISRGSTFEELSKFPMLFPEWFNNRFLFPGKSRNWWEYESPNQLNELEFPWFLGGSPDCLNWCDTALNVQCGFALGICSCLLKWSNGLCQHEPKQRKHKPFFHRNYCKDFPWSNSDLLIWEYPWLKLQTLSNPLPRGHYLLWRPVPINICNMEWKVTQWDCLKPQSKIK